LPLCGVWLVGEKDIFCLSVQGKGMV
jgi:hypothetical protein